MLWHDIARACAHMVTLRAPEKTGMLA